jgi:hypothetical protein
MASWMRARICWSPPDALGHPAIPAGPRYSTAARFDSIRERWPHEAWSIVVEFMNTPDERRCLDARVRLLNPEGPKDLLTSGSQFDLFEGARLVARGTVIGPEP